jgi:hypothetical protein
VPGAIDGLRTGLKGVAHHDVVNGFRVGARRFQGSFDGDATELLSAQSFQKSTGFPITAFTTNPFTKWGSCSTNDHNIFCHD